MALLTTLKNGKHWNARTVAERIIGSVKEADVEFHVGWVNYLDENGEWQEINCNYVEVADGFEVTEAPFKFHAPLFADEVATFESNVRFDVETKGEIKDASMVQTLKASDASHVKGEIFDLDGNGRADAVIYKQAFPQWDADLIYFVQHGRAPRLKKLVRFNSAPATDLQVNFEIGYNRNGTFEKLDDSTEVVNGKNVKKVLKTAWNEAQKVRSKDGFSVKAATAKSNKRGIGMKEFYIWDSADGIATLQKKQRIDVDFEKTGLRKYKLTKNVPASFFSDVVFPVFTDTTSTFYPDPNTETTSVDGGMSYEAGFGSWSTAVSATASNAGTGEAGISDSNANESYGVQYDSGYGRSWIGRLFFLFDTSAITSGATISAATLSLWGNADSSSNPGGTLNVYSSSPASNTALVVEDYDQVGSTALCDTAKNYIGGISTSGYSDFTLNASGVSNISKTGVSKFSLRSSFDTSNSPPSSTNFGGGVYKNSMKMAETAGTTNDPKLSVTYTSSVDVTASPSVLSATFSVPTRTVTGTANVAPSVLASTFSTQAPVATGGAGVSASVLSATFSIPTPNIITPDAQVNASVLSASFSVPSATVNAGASVAAGVLTATFSQPTATFRGDFSHSAGVLSATFSIPAPTITAIGNVTVSPSVLEATFSLPSTTVTAEQNASIAAGVLSATFSVQDPVVTAIQNVDLTATTLVATFSVQSPRKVGGLWTAQPRTEGVWTPQARAV